MQMTIKSLNLCALLKVDAISNEYQLVEVKMLLSLLDNISHLQESSNNRQRNI